uniref:Synaptopodin-2 n=1 Tax=Gallus gallus TaxID=9031 RepID=A0A8V0XHZ5_CHICK
MLPNCTRKMGTGDYICIAMSGGAPWGFRLQGGKEQKQPLQIAKVRNKSKAAKAGLCEGDEVVSINGKPCGDLTYAEVIVLMESLTDVLQMLIKRKEAVDVHYHFLGNLHSFLEPHLPLLLLYFSLPLTTSASQTQQLTSLARD